MLGSEGRLIFLYSPLEHPGIRRRAGSDRLGQAPQDGAGEGPLTTWLKLPAKPICTEMVLQAATEIFLTGADASTRQSARRLSPPGGRALPVRPALHRSPPNNLRTRSATPRACDSQRAVAGRSGQGTPPSHARPALASTPPPPAGCRGGTPAAGRCDRS